MDASREIVGVDPEKSSEDYNTPEDYRVVRKIDWALLPILTFLFLLSFLDRTNVGNAKLDGLVEDTHVSAAAYNTALALYFIGYVIFEVPSNIVLKRFDPTIWLPSLTLLWGIVTICQGFVTNQDQLFGIRFLLGVTEAGLSPGVIYLFSTYYRRRERAWRVAIFTGGVTVSGAFGGIFAYAIGLMNGAGGLKSWQWIFILEGLLTVVVSLFAYFIVPTWSWNAKFLTDSERNRLLERLQADSDAGMDQAFQWSSVLEAFGDHLIWAYSLLFHGFAFVVYTLSLFLPTIIADLGYKTWQAQLMTVPPYTLAFLVMGVTVWQSSKLNRRAPFIIASACLAIIGYIIVLSSDTPNIQYAGIFFAAAGAFTGAPLALSWPIENVSGQTKRAIAVAMQIGIGDTGAIVGVLIYRQSLSSNLYRIPNIIAIAYLLLSILMTVYLWVMMSRENKRRQDMLTDGKVDCCETEEQRIRLGDRSVHFVYQL